jgi:hypothetical protein
MVQRWFMRETTGLIRTHLLTTTDLVKYQCISKFFYNMMQQNILYAFCTINPLFQVRGCMNIVQMMFPNILS